MRPWFFHLVSFAQSIYAASLSGECLESANEPLLSRGSQQLLQRSVQHAAAPESMEEIYREAGALADLELQLGKEDWPSPDMRAQGKSSKLPAAMPQQDWHRDLMSPDLDLDHVADVQPRVANFEGQNDNTARWGTWSPVTNDVQDLPRDIALLQSLQTQELTLEDAALQRAAAAEAAEASIRDGAEASIRQTLNSAVASVNKILERAKKEQEQAALGHSFKPLPVDFSFEKASPDNSLFGHEPDNCGNGEGQVPCNKSNQVLTFDYSTSILLGIGLWTLIFAVCCFTAPIVRCLFEAAGVAIFILQLICCFAFFALLATLYFKSTD